MNAPTNPHHRSSRSRWATLAPPLLLGILALLVIGRMVMQPADDDGRGRTDSRAHARDEAQELPFEPAHVAVPSSWKLVEQRTGVTTWRASEGDDAVSVAAVEAAPAPLASIVADVARRARTAGPDTHVDAPRQLRATTRFQRDVVVELAMRTRVDGRDLYVRQVWRRDARAGRDIVATWTSGDETWEVDPATTVPTLDLR